MSISPKRHHHCSAEQHWDSQPVKFDPELHAENRKRLADVLRKTATKNAVVLLQGGEAQERHETDHEELFRQESNFAWAFGVKEPGCFGVIEVATGKSTLFVPKYPPEYGIWMGPIRTLESFKQEYLTDDVKFMEDIRETLVKMEPPRGPEVLTTRGLNGDTGRRAKEANFPGLEAFRINNGVAYDAICELRAIKTKRELDVLRHVCELSCRAHSHVMKEIKPGMFEYQLESIFLHYSYFCGGCRHTSYTSICGCGPSGSALHYGHAGAPNERLVRNGDICLMDMGAEGRFYGSDVTCSYPANGKFTEDQRIIYETVLQSQLAVMKAMKPGVFYVDMQELTYRIACERLRDVAKILVGDVEEMMKCNLGAVFMPHGLGHMLGVDTHDVAGRPEFSIELKRDSRDGYSKIRLLRPLREGMYVTVEPGIYFIDYLLDKALNDPVQSKFINRKRLDEFRGFGGVRIEDDVLITKTGVENFTRCPRTVQDIEAWMAGKISDFNQLDCPFSPKFEVRA
jgi:Xaa-Pro dipeptidase